MDATHLYGRSLLYRKNISNINTFKLMVKQDYSLLILVLTIFGSILFNKPELLLFYFMVLVIRSVLKNKLKYLFYFLIRDTKVLLGFIFFYPKKKYVSYISIE